MSRRSRSDKVVNLNSTRKLPYFAVPKVGYLPRIKENCIQLSVRFSRAKRAVNKLGKFKYLTVHSDNLESVLGENEAQSE